MSGADQQKEKKNANGFMPLAEAAKVIGYTPEYLNFLARKKMLRAEKVGRNWCTTREWLAEFVADLKENGKLADHNKSAAASLLAEAEKMKAADDFRRQFLAAKSLRGKEMEVIKEQEEKLKKQSPEKIPPAGRTQKIFTFSFLTAVLLLFLIGIPLRRYWKMEKNNQENKFPAGYIYDQKPAGLVMGEETEGGDKGIVLASESYKIKQVRFGGTVAVLSDEDVALKIDEVKSETFLDKKQEEATLIISWKTNKLAVSEIEYARNNGENPEQVSESSYGFSHSVAISKLDPGTAYIYSVKSKDRWGNEANSGYYAVYTGSKAVSIFELISQAVEEVFGWAVKK